MTEPHNRRADCADDIKTLEEKTEANTMGLTSLKTTNKIVGAISGMMISAIFFIAFSAFNNSNANRADIATALKEISNVGKNLDSTMQDFSKKLDKFDGKLEAIQQRELRRLESRITPGMAP